MDIDISYLCPVHLLKRQYPELKNAKHCEIFNCGRKARLFAECNGLDTLNSPTFSHNATWQSVYSKGWHGVTPSEIRAARIKYHGR